MTTTDYATYLAGLPRVLAAAAVLLRDAAGRVLVVEPDYRPHWSLPGGTIESDAGETPRQAARREAAEEIGLDVEPGALLAVDWVPGTDRPPIVAYVYDGGVLSGERLARIRVREGELLSWKLIGRDEIPAHLPGGRGLRVLAALDVLESGRAGPAELVDGRPAATA
ncbi:MULTISPECIES: NUDIX domain-containing protein [unclassified Streptomyces]|uniref:NUDIX domain-containing protein n=1 Tax=unclassified Streptomyces TaxID=2593676 RepID=UPI00367E5054